MATICNRHAVKLLVVHGSVLDRAPLRPPNDVDLAFRYEPDAGRDVVSLINELLDLTHFDGLDLMDLGRAGPVARARALGPDSVLLYESERGLFAETQMAAFAEEMDTRWLRRLDLELLAGK